MKDENMERLLPVLKYDGQDFLIDIPARLFRYGDDPTSGVSFYSELGKRMVKMCTNYDFRVYGLCGEA